MTEWKKYTGSPEQIAEILNAKHGFLCVNTNGICSDILINCYNNICLKKNMFGLCISGNLANYLSKEKTKSFLICNPHPNADMICQWAMTGQPVWIKKPVVYERVDTKQRSDVCYLVNVTCKPDWNIPGAIYSFTPLED